MAPRTSIGFGMSRWLTIRWRTTTSAASMAAAVPALSPTVHSKTTLFGAFSWSCGAPSCVAFSASTTAGSGSQSTSIGLEGVVRLLRRLGDDGGDALARPLHVVRGQDARRVDVVLDARPPPAGQATASGLYGMSAPVMTARTPGHRLRGRTCRSSGCWRARTGCAGWPGGAHPGELDVVEVVAVAGDEPRVLAALDATARPVRRPGSTSDRHRSVMTSSSVSAVMRHLAPVRRLQRACVAAASRIGGDDVVVAGAAADVALDGVADLARRSGPGSRSRRSAAAMIMPGVQKPHWRPCFSQNAFWSGCSSPSVARPSIVVTLDPSAWTARIVQDFTAWPSTWTVHAPHWRRVAADVGAGEVQVLAQDLDQQPPRLDVHLPPDAVDRQRDMLPHEPTSFLRPGRGGLSRMLPPQIAFGACCARCAWVPASRRAPRVACSPTPPACP